MQFKENLIQKFTSNTNLRKQDYLSEDKLSDRSHFRKKVSKLVSKYLFPLKLKLLSMRKELIHEIKLKHDSNNGETHYMGNMV